MVATQNPAIPDLCRVRPAPATKTARDSHEDVPAFRAAVTDTGFCGNAFSADRDALCHPRTRSCCSCVNGIASFCRRAASERKRTHHGSRGPLLLAYHCGRQSPFAVADARESGAAWLESARGAKPGSTEGADT